MKNQQSTKKNQAAVAKNPTGVGKKPVAALEPLFQKHNLMWLAIGGGVMLLGFILMMGGKNKDPHVFDTNVVYSTTRITIAPITIIIGILIMIYAFFAKSKSINA